MLSMKQLLYQAALGWSPCSLHMALVVRPSVLAPLTFYLLYCVSVGIVYLPIIGIYCSSNQSVYIHILYTY